MFSWIPSHVKAVWWHWGILLVFTWYMTGSIVELPAAVMVFLMGSFVADQAMHLSRFNHQDETLTGIEGAMIGAPWFFRLLGVAGMLQGLYMIVLFFRP